MRRTLLHYFARFTLFAGALPLFAVLQLLARLSFWSRIPNRLREELRGVAAGAQVSLSLVVLINTLDDLANNWPACSALAVGEGRTSRGSYLAGRNLDYPVFVDVLVDLQTLFLTTPDEGVPLVSLAWPGYVGVLTGMNRAGLTLAQLTAMCRDNTLQGLPAGLRNRLALERETSIQRLTTSLLKAPRTIGNNLLLAGPREALVLELSARRYEIRRPAAGLLTTTNHFQSPGDGPGQGGLFPAPPPGGPDPLPFHRDLFQGPQHPPPGTGDWKGSGSRRLAGLPGGSRHCQSRHGEQRHLRPGGTHPVAGSKTPTSGEPGAVRQIPTVGEIAEEGL